MIKVTPDTTLAEMYADMESATPSLPKTNENAQKIMRALFHAGAVAACYIIRETIRVDQEGHLTADTFNRLVNESEKYVKQEVTDIYEKKSHKERPDPQPEERND